MILEAAETICTLVAAGYAAHKIENAMIRAGMKSPLDDIAADRPPAPAAHPRPAAWSIEDARREAKLFMEVPGAFWLDPNRWGDDPNWRERLFPPPRDEYGDTIDHYTTENGIRVKDASVRIVDAPPCPVCPDGGKRTVMNIHGGEATMWDCFVCGTEFTRAGETKSSKKARHARNGNYTVLPCGHTGAVTRMRAPYTGYHVTRCDECRAEWEPRSDDATGRSLAQGETVFMPGDEPDILPAPPSLTTKRQREEARNRAWERMIAKGGNDGAGSCPDHDGCGWPVVRRNGWYYCTRDDCRHSKKGWR